MTRSNSHKHGRSGLRTSLRLSLAALVFGALGSGEASAYVGDSFMRVAGVTDNWRGANYTHWVRFNANYWKNAPLSVFGRRRGRSVFSIPVAPRQGDGALVVAIDKHSPVLSRFMEMCAKKTAIPEVTYAESADRARGSTEVGPRPASVPEYFEYKLKDVTLTSCPVVSGAPEQAFVVSFKNIEWLNYRGSGPVEPVTLTPAVMPAPQTSGITKTFVLNWWGYAQDVSDDQCQTMTEKPTEADYYRYFSPEKAALERTRLAGQGGPSFNDGQMCLRGPEQLNVCRLPGIVPDPVQPEPITKIARGLDLDGNDGHGNPPHGIRKHRNFLSTDGRTGIDNQLYVTEGCMRGLRGHLGQMMQYANEQRKNGQLAILVQITGIDDPKNDNNVDVTLLYSLDPTAKSGDGTKVLADYTFRVTDNLEFGHTFKRFPARIVNGVIVTSPTDPLNLVLPLDFKTTLFNPAMRLEILPDGTLKGILAGYQDWRAIVTANGHSLQESLFGSSVNAMYFALKRNADGMWNPVSHEYDGISSAWDIEGVPAFIPAKQQSLLLTQSGGASPSGNPR